MPTAKDLLRHAIQMLTYAPGTTLQVVMPALVLILGSTLAAAMLAPDTIEALRNASETMQMPSGSSLLILLVLLIVGLIGYALMAILWHRHVLLNGSGQDVALRPGGDIIRHYIWCAIVVGFVQFLAAFPVTIVMGILGAAFAGFSPAFSLTVISVLGGIIFAWVALRISIILPAAALGQRMRIAQSWQASAPISASLWGVAGFLAVINVGLTLLTSSLTPDAIAPNLIAGAVVYIIEGLIFVSVMTTLYGYLIEKRDLN